MKEYVTLGALEKEQYEALMKLIDNAETILAKVNEAEEKPKTTRAKAK